MGAMSPSRIYRELKRHGVSGAKRKLLARLASSASDQASFRILLITNRDSDNVGDQVIEECDIALIRAIMKNLGIHDYSLSSRAAGIISKKYLESRNPTLLQEAEKAISESDLIIFGGAPLFNFRYQVFHERTAITLQLAQQYDKPVLFSAIGIEGYEEESEACQNLKQALNLDCVRQITTRDDYASLERFVARGSLPIDRVADPAILSNIVFSQFAQCNDINSRDVVGLFVVRPRIFRDNGVSLTEKQLDEFWVSLIGRLNEAGTPYELITSGHFSDEAYLEHLVRTHGVSLEKCAFNMNTPEELVKRISGYKAILTCRLHPSIIAYSLEVPSVSLVWNSKVSFFYDIIGHPERALGVGDLSADAALDALEKACQTGTSADDAYRMSVYQSLFEGIRNILCPESMARPYNLSQLRRNIIPFRGTTDKEKQAKLERKFRRTYDKFNRVSDQNQRLKKRNATLKTKVARLRDDR